MSLGIVSCDSVPQEQLNPFTDLDALAFDGRRRTLRSEITPLGSHRAGDVLQITVRAGQARAVYLLEPDPARTTAGLIVGGGPVNRPFVYRVARDSQLYLFIDRPDDASVVLEPGPGEFQPPPGQTIVLEFVEDFLAAGLFDSATHDEADRGVLRSIEPVVRSGILERMRAIFADTGVVILGPDDPRSEPFSVISFSGQRVAEAGPDAAVAPGTAEVVLLGEVLPRGHSGDPGNQNPSDQAVVYVGSFRGTFVMDAVNNIINPLAATGAHEAGHLLGLNHTALDGLMTRNLSFAFQRQLGFQRSQIALDVGNGPEIFTNVIQDPQVYFDRIFSGSRD
jgi:hypothetical protein